MGVSATVPVTVEETLADGDTDADVVVVVDAVKDAETLLVELPVTVVDSDGERLAKTDADTVTLRVGVTVGDAVVVDDRLVDCVSDALRDALMLGVRLNDSDGDTLPLAEVEDDNDREALTLAERDIDSDGDREGDIEGDADVLGVTAGDTDGDGEAEEDTENTVPYLRKRQCRAAGAT